MLLPLQLNNLLESAAPVFSGPIPDISETRNTGTNDYDLGQYFTGADSYGISPSVEAGWTFNTSTGLLTVDTDESGDFGPYTVTATNTNGSTASNSFGVAIAASQGSGGVDPDRFTFRNTKQLDDDEAVLEVIRLFLDKAA